MKQAAGKLIILKRRTEFLRCRNGLRWAGRTFVIEAKVRPIDNLGHLTGGGAPRFGFTATKQLGNAVRRNRIRRRLKAAALTAASGAMSGFDYVVIARNASETCAFAQLEADFAAALAALHRPGPRGGEKRPRAAQRTSSKAAL